MSYDEYLRAFTNFVPFETISLYVSALFSGRMNIDIPIKNLAGNLLMFLPLGFYLPYFAKKIMGIGKFILFSVAILLLIEAIQLLTMTGSFDIDDLILNLAGAIVGFFIFKKLMTKIKAN